ncbi:hypothetical protein GCM10018793_42430 [Streptomyces sulfonofaciens]|uniref:Uncharacterized protein n=1 Tax=Streptomyces sulfonofaciens TaxID=68272 RepID=A0A919L3E8_9ACTN|nr:hypothetical protein GCM10018793_42430 [Streptomyces sulfonofaciens]
MTWASPRGRRKPWFRRGPGLFEHADPPAGPHVPGDRREAVEHVPRCGTWVTGGGSRAVARRGLGGRRAAGHRRAAGGAPGGRQAARRADGRRRARQAAGGAPGGGRARCGV